MSFVLENYGGYGRGTLGDVTDPPYAVVNAYAAVEEIKTYSLLVIPIGDSQYQSWSDCVGCQVLVHAVASKSGRNKGLGQFAIATITGTTQEDGGLRLALDTDYTLLAQEVENNNYCQAVLIPEFKNLKLQSKSVKPGPFSLTDTPIGGYDPVFAPCGGIVAFKCSETLTLAGGHVDLRDAGFSTGTNTTYRPNLSHETNGALDTDLHSGSENSVTKDRLLLNCGDGACLIMAKSIVCSSGSSRIGNPSTSGFQYCRGASDSKNLPSGVSNQGGSSIFIATESFTNFTPGLIAKYRSTSSGTGRGLARAYLAVEAPGNSIIPDEGLYALDCTQNLKRVKERFNISGFGKGTDGDYTVTSNPTLCWNSYAKVTAISGRVYTISRVSGDAEEKFNFEVGRLVMIHQSRKSSGTDYTDGDFKISRITAISGSTVTIKHNFSFNLSTYNVQMIVVPEFNNLTLAAEYNTAPRFQNGAGGIFAIAVMGTCNLSGAKINMEGKGTFSSVVNVMQSNFFMKRGLPLGQGNGSVFILARTLTVNTNTRLGGTQDGSQFGGDAINSYSSSTSFSRGSQGGWKGADGLPASTNTTHTDYIGGGGSGSAAGTCPYDSNVNGGWHSSAKFTDENYVYGCQGAHVLIVADTINGLCLHALSTGGKGGKNLSTATGVINSLKGGDGGCGYGGGGHSRCTAGNSAWAYGGVGGYRGGAATAHPATAVDYAGGGGAGACFVYCNNADSQDNTNNILY